MTRQFDQSENGAPRVAGLVLAAGESRRMGEPKQLLMYEGESLLRRAARAAVAGGVSPVTVVLGAGAARMTGELDDLPVEHVINEQWRRGIGSSIHAGVQALCAQAPKVDAILIMVCDQPLLGAAHVRDIVSAYHRDGGAVVATAYDGELGVPALFDRSRFDALLSLPDSEGAKEIIMREGAAARLVHGAAGACDVDTPEGYARLLAGIAPR